MFGTLLLCWLTLATMKYVISRRVSLAQMFRRREAKLEALQETCEQLRKALQLVKYIYIHIYII